MDQDQNQQKSSVDRTNDFLNNARGVYQKGKRLKKTIQAIRATRAIAAVGQRLSLGSIIGIIFISLLLATFFLSLMGGGAVTGTEAPEEEPLPEENVCTTLDIPGLICDIDAPSHVENGESYVYRIYGSYEMPEGGREPSTFVLKLSIPSNIIEFTGGLPGVPTPITSGFTTTYSWLLSKPENLALFNLVAESEPVKYTFDFSITARPKEGIEDTIATVEFIIE